MIKLLKQRIGINDLLISAFFAVTFTLLGPLETIAVNVNQINFVPRDVWYVFFILSVVVFLVILLLLMFLPEKVKLLILATVFAGTFMGYVQANFLNPTFGFIDQNEIAWDDMKLDMVFNGIIWLVVIALVFFIFIKKPKLATYLCYIAALLSCMQIVATVSLLFISNEKESDYITGFSHESLINISENENVFMFVLDATSGYAMDDMEEKFPDALQNFNDFTRFTNFASIVQGTKPVVAMLATGFYEYDSLLKEYDEEQFDPTEEVERYYETAWNNSIEFYDILEKNGYVSYIHPWGGASSYLTNFSQANDKISNIVTVDENIQIDYLVFIKSNIATTMFKYVPLFFKQFLVENFTIGLYGYNDFGSVDNLNYLKYRLEDNRMNYISENIFSIIHVKGSHGPIDQNEFVEFVGQDKTSIGQQTKGAFSVLDKFINELKSKGVYDNSTIIILADHGTSDYDEKGNFSSVLLIKRKNEKHDEMQINNAPVTHSQITPTIVSEISSAEGVDFGDTVYDVSQETIIDRVIYRYTINEQKSIAQNCEHVYTRIDFTNDVNELAFSSEEFADLPIVPMHFCLYCDAPITE